MIIAHLTRDTRSLLTCTLTCYSWYIIAVPHLHHTLIVSTPGFESVGRKLSWPKPLVRGHELGLLPLVKEFRVRAFSRGGEGFSPERFNRSTLRQFSALTNVRELWIETLNIPKFMRRVQKYFGHFLPTVRSLALDEPKGSHRQVLHFIGQFRHLDDLKLLFSPYRPNFQEGQADDLELIPPFAPPLRGRLTMRYSKKVELVKDMIELFGGIRFHSMDLLDVNGMRLLLHGCVETLEILRLRPNDPRCGWLPPKGV